MEFERSWKIYVGDTDCFGFVYTPVVVDYAIRTLQDFREALGFTNDYYQENGFIAPARNVDIDYVGNVVADDDLAIRLVPVVGSTSITYEVTGTVEGDLVFEGSMTMVYVSREDNDPIEVPDEIRRLMTE